MRHSTVSGILEHFALKRPGEWERAARQYFGDRWEHEEVPVPEELWRPFFCSWFLYDYQTKKEKKSPMTVYCSKNPDDLPESQLAMLQTFQDTQVFDAFEIQEVRKKKSMTLKQIRTGITFQVRERSGTRYASIGDVLFTRVMQVGDHWELAGEGMSYPQDSLPMFALHCQDHPEESFPSKEVFQMILKKSLAEEPPEPREALQQFLKGHCSDGSVTVDQIIEWMRETKDIYAVVRRALEFVQPKDKEQLNDFTQLVTNVWNTLSPEDRGGQSGSIRREPGPVESALMTQFIDRGREEVDPDNYDTQREIDEAAEAFEKRWLDTPQAALEGKTPREAVAKERLAMGQKDTEWTIKLQVSYIGAPDEERMKAMFERAIELTHKGEYVEAEHLYRELIELWEDNYQFWGNLGLVLSFQGKKEEAVASLEKAVEINPEYQLAHENLASIRHASVGDLKKQKPTFTKASVLRLDFRQAVNEWVDHLSTNVTSNAPAVRDATTFLRWVQKDGPITIHSKYNDLPRKIVHEINSLFVEPDEAGIGNPGSKDFMPFNDERQFPTVSRLHGMCIADRWMKYRKKKLSLTKSGRQFLQWSANEQFCALLWNYFRKLSWASIAPAQWVMENLPTNPEAILQFSAERYIGMLLGEWRERDAKWMTLHFGSWNRRNTEEASSDDDALINSLTGMIGDFFDQHRYIWKLLAWFGLLEMREHRGTNHCLDRVDIRLTDLGERIIPTLTTEAYITSGKGKQKQAAPTA
jgi:hypothetical protein